jgi:hypothetical protein
MSKVKPIRPTEAKSKKLDSIPDEMIEAVNEMIAENLSESGRSSFKAKDLITRFRTKYSGSEDVYKKKWLDFEDIYRKAGWKVSYESPSYGDSDFDPYFTFIPK